MKKVYKSKESEIALLKLYDKQLKQLNVSYEDLWIETRYGKAHVIKLGKTEGKPILFFHGGNSTAPYYLKNFKPLFEKYCFYAVDTVGHPGKSSQTVLSPKTLAYGEWASDVISGLGFQKMYCMGGSFGGGVLVKLMCVAPEKIEKGILIVPSAISNVSTLNITLKMAVPMMFYIFTKKEKWLKKAIIPMAVEEKNIDPDTYEMVKNSFEHATVKVGMPSNVKAIDLKNCKSPIFVITTEKDYMFPGKKVIERAKKNIPNVKTYMLENQGHMCILSNDVQNMISEFINE